jgi:hypothetical protein
MNVQISSLRTCLCPIIIFLFFAAKLTKKCVTVMARTKAQAKRKREEENVNIEVIDDEEEEEEDPDAEFEIETIMFSRKNDYFVKWKGYSVKKATWEPKSGLSSAQEIVEEYEKVYKERFDPKLLQKGKEPPFVLKNIKGERCNEKGKLEYEIVWKFYPMTTWEPAQVIPKIAIEKYQKKKKLETNDDSIPNESPARKRTKIQHTKEIDTVAAKEKPKVEEIPETPTKPTTSKIIEEIDRKKYVSKNVQEIDQSSSNSPGNDPMSLNELIKRYPKAEIINMKKPQNEVLAVVQFEGFPTVVTFPVAEVRHALPQEIITFLLKKLQFRS